jgi:hypothetical protein
VRTRYPLTLTEAYPNPFSEATTINYSLSDTAPVRLFVYDVLGREVARLVEARQGAGRYRVTLDGRILSPGVYFYRIGVGSAQTTRMIIRQ